MTNLSEELEMYDEEWEDIEVREPSTPLPLGTYQVEITEARVELSGGEYDDKQLTLVFRVLSGEYSGSTHRKWINLDTEVGRQIAKTDVDRIGVEVPKLSDLPRLTDLMIGVRLEIALVKGSAKRNGGFYTNTFINRRLDEESIYDAPDEYDNY